MSYTARLVLKNGLVIETEIKAWSIEDAWEKAKTLPIAGVLMEVWREGCKDSWCE